MRRGTISAMSPGTLRLLFLPDLAGRGDVVRARGAGRAGRATKTVTAMEGCAHSWVSGDGPGDGRGRGGAH